MTTLHLGVIDMPYAQAPARLRARRVSGTQTTGDVAEILEAKYHVMELFYEENAQFVADKVSESLQGALESLMMGAGNAAQIDPFGGATSEIEDRFKQFLSMKEVEKLGIPGVPTKAALRGVNHRLKHPYRRRGARPSFVDTSLYMSSFKAWAT